MKVQDLTLTDELRDIVQIGIITDDIERTKKGMLEVFGLKPDAGGHSVYKKSVYRDGKVIDAEVVSAFYNFSISSLSSCSRRVRTTRSGVII